MTKKQQILKEITEYCFNAYRFQSAIYGHALTTSINMIPGLKHTFSDTILRYLRQLKQSGKIDYICRDRKKSIYEITKFQAQ